MRVKDRLLKKFVCFSDCPKIYVFTLLMRQYISTCYILSTLVIFPSTIFPSDTIYTMHNFHQHKDIVHKSLFHQAPSHTRAALVRLRWWSRNARVSPYLWLLFPVASYIFCTKYSFAILFPSHIYEHSSDVIALVSDWCRAWLKQGHDCAGRD